MKTDELIKYAIEEDIQDGDHSSLATIPADAIKKARLIAKEDGIIAGIRIAKKVFESLNKEVIFKTFFKDGQPIKKGDLILEVEGNAIQLLSAERLALNFMQRMSGIATYTRFLVDKIAGTDAKILDTRKTTPLMRSLEKEAVKLGGAHNHRFGLYDMVMIKDNHIDFAGGISQAITATNKYLQQHNKVLKIEIEVRNFEELQQVLTNGNIDRIMLDNFSPENLKKAIGIINKKYETEASGGISENNIRAYAETGVDYISVGALTHQIKSLDMSLLAIK